MATAAEYRESELDFNQYGGDGTDCLVDWDSGRIPAVVSDAEYLPGDREAGIQRKMLSVRKSDLNVLPEIGDEIRLNMDPEKVDSGQYWRVEKVVPLEFEYDIYFCRYVS